MRKTYNFYTSCSNNYNFARKNAKLKKQRTAKGSILSLFFLYKLYKTRS